MSGKEKNGDDEIVKGWVLDYYLLTKEATGIVYRPMGHEI
jgi:hypothetical protein